MPGNVTGLREIKRNIKRNDASIRGALAAALYMKGFAIDADMVPLIPVDFGILRGSHYVAPPTNTRRPRVQVGVGTDYALPVHEREDLRHNPPTRSKFLEVVVVEHRRGYADWIAKATRNNIKSGRTVRSIPVRAPKTPKVAREGEA